MKNIGIKKAAVVSAAVVLLSGVGIGVISAQGPVGPGGPSTVAVGFAPLVCSTTNYTDVAAKALGMQDSELRQALVSGKSLDQIASSKQVSLQTVEDALKSAHDADIDQAVKDGLITQQVADQMKSMLERTPQSNATPDATAQANQNNRPLRPRLAAMPGFMLRVPEFNTVNSYAVAAKAIGVSCADLVKSLQSGQSIAQVATSKNVQVQTVIDALVSADKAAIAQDVQEGLLAQVQADVRIAQATNRAGMFVYTDHQLGRGGFGPGGMPFGGMPFGPRNGNRNGQGGFPGFGGQGGFPGFGNGSLQGSGNGNGNDNQQGDANDNALQQPQAPASPQ